MEFNGAYVELKITDENIKLAQKIGKILSKKGIATNFTNHHLWGKVVDYWQTNSSGIFNTEWLNLASQILENPENFEDVKPNLYYHENFYPSYKPRQLDIEEKLLKFLLRKRGRLPEITSPSKMEKLEKKSWKEKIKVKPKPKTKSKSKSKSKSIPRPTDKREKTL